MDATIITIGDEILIGQITDTNSAFIAKTLNNIGVRIKEIRSISDNKNRIINTLNDVLKPGGLVLMTGGLGPTSDDITKKVLAEYTGAQRMVLHEEQLTVIEYIALKRKIPMSALNRAQAEVPDTCEVLLNCLGTAPGMWFAHNGAVLVSLPGVPFEMQALMQEKVMPGLQQRFQLRPIYHRTLMTFGLPESMLAECIAPWENALPPYLKLAYLPNPLTGVKLRLSAYDTTQGNVAEEVERQVWRLRQVIGDALYGEESDTLEQVVGRLLLEKGATVAVAESCTGGAIASLITSVPGSSAYFKGAVVAYDNAVKTGLLGVADNTLQTHGAVSLPVVEQMAVGVRRALNADYAIATSGIAGPGGGTPEKPVGTVCFAVASPSGVHAERLSFAADRARNIARASANALNLLRMNMLKNN
ncbi:MAG: competence/damage-inducible protein A [Prevotellaceae bacterium]|jgi:nicotinamide-nucleotide amidase|nr:competence/damage-inducible protein A [Prevotellaceae bacterium]